MWLMAKCLQYGIDVKFDLVNARKMLALSAAKGFAPAMCDLGVMLKKGEGAPANPVAAASWFRLAMNAGSIDGIRELATMYLSDEGVDKDPAEAIRLFRLAADRGDPRSMRWLGYIYENGDGVSIDVVEANAWYVRGADAGNVYAMENLAGLLQSGQLPTGIDKDLALAWVKRALQSLNLDEPVSETDVFDVQWSRLRVELYSDPADLIGVADGYFYVMHDQTKALRWYQRAADVGNRVGMWSMGVMYINGFAVERNAATAADWFRKGADMGDSRSMRDWATCQYYGRGVGVDAQSAINWLERAAAKGETQSLVELAVIYRFGKRVPCDYANALELYRRAIARNSGDAMVGISTMYADGLGVKRDARIAQQWLYRSLPFHLSETANIQRQYDQRTLGRKRLKADIVAAGVGSAAMLLGLMRLQNIRRRLFAERAMKSEQRSQQMPPATQI